MSDSASNGSNSDFAGAEALARQFLDLWQEQFAALATDPQMAEAMALMFSAVTTPGTAAQTGGGAKNDRSRNDSSDAPGPAAAAAAPDDLRRDLDELRRRVAALEEQLDALAPGAGDGGGKAGKAGRGG